MAGKPQHLDSKTRISQVTWRKWSGRQWKTIFDQAKLYGFPLDRDGIHLPAFAAWFHNFLAANAAKLSRHRTKGETQSPALERWRRARARAAEIELMKMQRVLVPLEALRQFHNIEAKLMLNAAHRLEVRFGPDARQIYDALIDDIEREAGEFFLQKQWDGNGNPINSETEGEQWDSQNENEQEPTPTPTPTPKPKRPKRPAKRKPKSSP